LFAALRSTTQIYGVAGKAMAAKKRKRTQPYKHGVPAKYVAGAKNPRAAAAEMKSTAAKYKRGEKIDIKAVERARAASKKRRKKKA
tara:strand:+ start:40 stop:297 length:258 start_codon:yes stop_codon:yes gene_type:complete